MDVLLEHYIGQMYGTTLIYGIYALLTWQERQKSLASRWFPYYTAQWIYSSVTPIMPVGFENEQMAIWI